MITVKKYKQIAALHAETSKAYGVWGKNRNLIANSGILSKDYPYNETELKKGIETAKETMERNREPLALFWNKKPNQILETGVGFGSEFARLDREKTSMRIVVDETTTKLMLLLTNDRIGRNPYESELIKTYNIDLNMGIMLNESNEYNAGGKSEPLFFISLLAIGAAKRLVNSLSPDRILNLASRASQNTFYKAECREGLLKLASVINPAKFAETLDYFNSKHHHYDNKELESGINYLVELLADLGRLSKKKLTTMMDYHIHL